MKKWNKILATLLLFISVNSFAQETFDIITYSAPASWTKDAKNGVVSYSTVDQTAGTFCVVAIYASKAGSGNATKDFESEWAALVVTPFNATSSPQTETQKTDDGWDVVIGVAPVKIDGADLYIILTVFSGHGKKISVRSSLNNQSYSAQLDELLASFKLDSKKNETIVAPSYTSNSSSGKFGMMKYDPIPGWSHQVFQDGVVFKPLDLPKGEHLSLQIMQPMNFQGTLEQALAKSYDEAALMYNSTKMHYAGGANYQKTDPKRSFQNWEYMLGSGGVQIENGTPYKTEMGLDVFVIKINDRFERIAVFKSRPNCSYSRYYSTDRLSYTRAINNFLYNLQFTDGQAPQLQPGSSNGSGIVGIWQGISMQMTVNSGLRYSVFSPVFFTNGQAYFGSKFLIEGLYELDSRLPPEINRRDWGTYTFSNGRGVLKMPYADIPLRMDGDNLVITANQTDHRFFQLPSVDGAKFNGTYTMEAVNGKIPSIRFGLDGTFADNGALKVLYHEYVDCTNAALLPGSGTYFVKDHTIVFNYADGRKVFIAFPGYGYDRTNTSPATLSLSYDENLLTRQ